MSTPQQFEHDGHNSPNEVDLAQQRAQVVRASRLSSAARNVRRAELLAGINAAYSIIDRARAELAELDKKD